MKRITENIADYSETDTQYCKLQLGFIANQPFENLDLWISHDFQHFFCFHPVKIISLFPKMLGSVGPSVWSWRNRPIPALYISTVLTTLRSLDTLEKISGVRLLPIVRHGRWWTREVETRWQPRL